MHKLIAALIIIPFSRRPDRMGGVMIKALIADPDSERTPIEMTMMRTSTHAAAWTAALIAAVIFTGCAGMSDTTRRTTTGAGMGAATGALIGSFSGDAGKGALIGGAVGAAGGYLYDQSQKGKGH